MLYLCTRSSVNMKNLNPHPYTLPQMPDNGQTGLPLCSGVVLFMEQPRLIEDLGIIYPNPTSPRKRHYCFYECPFCGRKFRCLKKQIDLGKTKSCGCYNKSGKTNGNYKHGLRNKNIYHIWRGMIDRCTNPNSTRFSDYGGRGITVCKEWINIVGFYDWAINNGYADNLQIDRKNNDGNYCSGNCRWTTREINIQNGTLVRSNNKSGYRGVCSGGWKNRKWVAQIKAFINHIIWVHSTPPNWRQRHIITR
jgi:hypothetical protein